MSNHKFTVGKYKTRDGRDAVVLMDDATGTYPLVGYVVWPDNKKEMHTWRDDGMFNGRSGDRADLLPPPAKLRPWRPEEVPLGTWIRDRAQTFRGILISVGKYNTVVGQAVIGIDLLFDDYEHSTDNGVTWKPCGVEE